MVTGKEKLLDNSVLSADCDPSVNTIISILSIRNKVSCILLKYINEIRENKNININVAFMYQIGSIHPKYAYFLSC